MNHHAVVLGGSVAGLVAARVLASRFERVTIVERDVLDVTVPASRKGVPQDRQGHALLASGLRILEGLFPGYHASLVEQGATPCDATGDFLWYQFGAWKLRTSTGLLGVIATRPLIESEIRRRVLALPNVTVLAEHDVDTARFDRDRHRVIGVMVTERATGTSRALDADLVVDATGRGSRSPAWLAAWGFEDVPVSKIACDITYVSAMLERRVGDFRGASGGIVAGTPPDGTRAGAVFAIEGDRWLVTLVGIVGERPPTTSAGFRAFAQALPTQDIFELLRDREPLEELRAYRFPASQRRHYERLRRFPEGYVVIGDAICSFNPIYGQGMSVALAEAEVLGACLAEGKRRLARRFFARASAIIDAPWTIAVGEDLRYSQVDGRRPPGFGWTSRYFERMHRVAAHDPLVLRRLFEVAHLVCSPLSLFSPAIALRVLFGRGLFPASALSPRRLRAEG